MRSRVILFTMVLALFTIGVFGQEGPVGPLEVTKVYTFSGSLNAFDQTQTPRLSRTGNPATCGTHDCALISSGNFRYDSFIVINPNAYATCYRAVLTSTCGVNAFAAAYMGGFDPANLCTNHVGDAGNSASGQAFSFIVPGYSSFSLVVSEVSAGLGCASYTLDLYADAATGDFDLNRRTDLVWRNFSTGQNALWYMNGTTVAGTTLIDSNPDTMWHIQGVADMNADGYPDLVWRQYGPGGGNNAVWYMNNATRIGTAYLDPNTDLGWDIMGAGDFNVDGKPDLVWRHYSSGENAIWLMDGVTATTKTLIASNPDTSWRIQAVGDFNGDLNSDLVWRNVLTGENAVWFMTGTTYTSAAYLSTVPDAAWEIAAAGDYNGDSKTDLAWRNYSTGENAVWLMDGTTLVTGVVINSNPDLSWHIVGPPSGSMP